jgi:hypothetical protein
MFSLTNEVKSQVNEAPEDVEVQIDRLNGLLIDMMRGTGELAQIDLDFDLDIPLEDLCDTDPEIPGFTSVQLA